MPAALRYELEGPVTEEAVDREELARLAYWYWITRVAGRRPGRNWWWAEEALRRQHLAAGYKPEEV